MTIRARYSGTCAVCGKRISVGEKIEWDKATKTVVHPECASALTEPAPYTLRGGSGYGYRGWQRGQIVRASDRLRENGYPEWLYVVRAKREYCSEDGMSFGVGDESGYLYTAWCREATPEETAPYIAKMEAEQIRRQKLARVNAIADMIRIDGELPAYSESNATGEILLDTFNAYGSGTRFVIDSDSIWFVQNNGMDGDDWSRNNAPGMICWRIPMKMNERLADELRSLANDLQSDRA